MPSVRKRSIRLALALLLIAAAGTATVVLLSSRQASPAAPAVPTVPSVLVKEADGFRYEYHVPTGRESLFDNKADPRHLHNVLQDHKEAAAKYRRALEEEQQVPNLEVLRAKYEDQIRRLKALGYL